MSKRGRLSKDEQKYILDMAGKVANAQIAKRMNRTEECVADFIATNYVASQEVKLTEDHALSERNGIRQELKNSLSWRQLKDEFMADELKVFEEKYVSLMSQFRDDVLATEETQIMHAIKYELLMYRNLRARQRALQDIERLEETQKKFLERFAGDPSIMSDQEKNYALNVETQLVQARSAEQSRTSEYVKLQEQHGELMKGLKATRDQRIKQIESSKVSFLSLLKELQNRERQEQVGRRMELMHLAGEKAYDTLGRPHQYEDHSTDSPILSPETVDLGPEEQDEPQ